MENGHDNDDDNGEGSQASKDNVPKKKRRKEFLNLNATFMAGVPGVMLVTDQVNAQFTICGEER